MQLDPSQSNSLPHYLHKALGGLLDNFGAQLVDISLRHIGLIILELNETPTFSDSRKNFMFHTTLCIVQESLCIEIVLICLKISNSAHRILIKPDLDFSRFIPADD